MSEEDQAGRCVLQHRGFAALGEVLFRRSASDRTPVLAVELGGREAAIPLRALQRELAIADDSADGRMLGLIAEALDYVPDLRPGQMLPAEVLTGDASWEPGAAHVRRALTRLRLQLLAWLATQGGDALPPEAMAADRIETDPRLRAILQDAFGRAARALDLPDSAAVVSLLEGIASELAYIEALRDALLVPAQAMLECLDGLGAASWRGDATRVDALAQVQRLGRIAVGQIGQRFSDVDAQTGEVIATLRNVDGQRVFIRGNRDWLHRTRLAWTPIMRAWAGGPRRLDDATWTLIGRTYQFLAQRCLPAQEWVLAKSAWQAPKAPTVLHW